MTKIIIFTLLISNQLFCQNFELDYLAKPDGIYFIITDYYCTSCLATLINDVSSDLENQNIYSETHIYSKNEFHFKKFENLFNKKPLKYEISKNIEKATVYIIKKNNFLIVSNLHQLLDSRKIIEDSKKILSIDIKTIDSNEMVFSIDKILNLNDNLTFFSDSYTGKVFKFNKSNNRIENMDFKMDSLQEYYFEYNKTFIPYIWENGTVDTSDAYSSLLKSMPRHHRISSFFKNDGKPNVVFSFITHLNNYIDKSNNIPSYMAQYTSFTYDFTSDLIEKSKLYYFQFKSYQPREVALYSDSSYWLFSEIKDGEPVEVILSIKDFPKVYDLGDNFLFLNKDSLRYINKENFKIISLQNNLTNFQQFLPDFSSNSSFFTINKDNKKIIIKHFKLEKQLIESTLIIDNKIFIDDNFLGVLDLEKIDNTYKIKAISEEQNIFEIKIEN